MSIDHSDAVGFPDKTAGKVHPCKLSKRGDTSTRAQQRKAWWAMMRVCDERKGERVKRRMPR